MAWEERTVFDQRKEMFQRLESGIYGLGDLARLYGVSPRTLWKWRQRYEMEGFEGLRDRSRQPHSSPRATSETIVAKLLAAKKEHPFWGPKKIRCLLVRQEPTTRWPASSTVGEIFKKHGLVKARRKRRIQPKRGKPDRRTNTPNDLMTIDFKGEFRLGNGKYCYPLTVADEHSCWIHGCRALHSTAFLPVKAELITIFRKTGLPLAILSDNGSPFCSNGLRRLGRLDVWLIELAIEHRRSRPACPQDNPRHERMHLTMKAETTRPPEPCFEGQQARFDDWAEEYNTVRPHESLANQPPSSLWVPSPRPFPEVIQPPDYAGHLETRLVNPRGHFKFKGHRVFLSEVFSGKRVAVEEIADQVWSILFYNIELARFSGSDWKAW